jgi:hypothetical protein
MPGPQDALGQMMNPLQPAARNPPVPNATMVAPAAPQQPQPAAPQQPPQLPQAPGAPPAGMPPPGMAPMAVTQPAGPPPTSMIIPQRMPDILQLLMSRAANAQPNSGLQSTPLAGQPPTVGGM